MAIKAIDKGSPMPYYRQLADLLTEELERDRPENGVLSLPSESELMVRFRVGRATVRQALSVLERQGLIYRERGRGSFAPARRVQQEVTRLVSTTEDMRRRGWTVTTRLISLDRIAPTAKVANALGVDTSSPIYRLRRLRIVDGGPLSVQVSHLRPDLCPDLDRHDLETSLYSLLENVYGLRLWTAQQVLRARDADREEADLLGVKPGTPVMYAERITYSVEGTPVEYLESVWRGDRYDFVMNLSRPQV